MLRDIVDDIVRTEPDMELVGRGDDCGLDVALKRYEPDVVILEERTADISSICELLLVERRHMSVIAVTGDGRAASLIEVRRVALAEPSPSNLVDAIRGALQGGRHGSG
jgi:DNA-binding NarL/FixJ family response regulator